MNILKRFLPEKRPGVGSVLGTMFIPNVRGGFTGMYAAGNVFVQLLAIILADLKLIPKNHPFITAEKLPRGSLMELVRLAASNAKYDKQHLPQTLVFVGIMVSLFFSAIVFALVVLKILGKVIGFGIAHAAEAGGGAGGSESFFSFANDKAMSYLIALFGTDGTAAGTNITKAGPLASALTTLLTFYSSVILILAALLILYYLIRMVVETAHYGVPLGKNHNMLWTPIRLVFALMLLVPVANGFNVGQYMVFNVARWGSAMGSNAWAQVADHLNSKQEIMANPPIARPRDAIIDMMKSVVCAVVYNRLASQNDNLTQEQLKIGAIPPTQKIGMIDPALASSGGYYNVVYGTYANPYYCGGVKFKDPAGSNTDTRHIYIAHLNAFRDLAAKVYDGGAETGQLKGFIEVADIINGTGDPAKLATKMSEAFNTINVGALEWDYMERMGREVSKARGSSDQRLQHLISQDVIDAGWVGAPIYFMKLAGMSRELSNAALTAPEGIAPKISQNDQYGQQVLRVLALLDREIAASKNSNKIAKSKHAAALDRSGYEVSSVNSLFDDDKEITTEDAKEASSGFLDKLAAKMINGIGRGGVVGGGNSWALVKVDPSNPVAGLTSLGSTLQALNGIAFAISMIMSAQVFGNSLGLAGSPISMVASFMMSAGWGAGFALAYMLPLLPGIRFFFGIMSWLTFLFEALVGIPLFALAHLRTDGDGLPGGAVKTGYWLMLNIFLRPIMLIFGLFAFLMLFNVGIWILNSMFDAFVDAEQGMSAMDTLKSTDASLLDKMKTGGSIGVSIDAFKSIVLNIIYAIFAYSLFNSTVSLIDKFAEGCLNMIGGGSFKDGNELAGAVGTAMKAGAFVGGVMSSAPEGVGKIASGIKQKKKDAAAEDQKKIADMVQEERDRAQLDSSESLKGIERLLGASQAMPNGPNKGRGGDGSGSNDAGNQGDITNLKGHDKHGNDKGAERETIGDAGQATQAISAGDAPSGRPWKPAEESSTAPGALPPADSKVISSVPGTVYTGAPTGGGSSVPAAAPSAPSARPAVIAPPAGSGSSGAPGSRSSLRGAIETDGKPVDKTGQQIPTSIQGRNIGSDGGSSGGSTPRSSVRFEGSSSNTAGGMKYTYGAQGSSSSNQETRTEDLVQNVTGAHGGETGTPVTPPEATPTPEAIEQPASEVPGDQNDVEPGERTEKPTSEVHGDPKDDVPEDEDTGV